MSPTNESSELLQELDVLFIYDQMKECENSNFLYHADFLITLLESYSK